MRVTVLLAYADFPNGGAMVLYEHANALARHGHRVTLVHGAPRSWESPPPLTVPNPHWFAIEPAIEQRYVRIVSEESLPDADVLLNGAYFGRFAECKGKNAVFVQSSGLIPWEEEGPLLRAPGPKICVSGWLRDVVLGAGVAPEEVFHVPNGVDHSTFRVTVEVADRPRRCAMLYNALSWKGGDVGIEAVRRLHALLPDVEIMFFGVFPRHPDIPDFVEYRQRPSRAELVDEIYNRSSVLLCPSRTEGFYLCGLEAFACGCAFVSTDVGGVRDYAEHGVTALLSPVEDASRLADNAARVLSDRTLRLGLTRAALERVQAFDWRASTRAVEDILDRCILQGRGVPGSVS